MDNLTNQALTCDPQGNRKPDRPENNLEERTHVWAASCEISSLSEASFCAEFKEDWRTKLSTEEIIGNAD